MQSLKEEDAPEEEEEEEFDDYLAQLEEKT